MVAAADPRPVEVVLCDPTLSNAAFLDRYGGPGRIGLAGMTSFVDRRIRKSQRRLHPDRLHSLWSHAFLCEGRRLDGQQWLLESDLDVAGRFVRLGVQENRADKYADPEQVPNLAVLDCGLDAAATDAVLRAGLDLLAAQASYPIRKVLGTWLAVRTRELDRRFGPDDGRQVYCSAFVRRCYLAAGIDLAPGVLDDNTTPEHLATTPVPHRLYLLNRAPA